jgi:type 1 fimbria pilin
MSTKKIILLFFMFFSLWSIAHASLGGGKELEKRDVNIGISGTIVSNAKCQFSSDKVIKVEFGDVYIKEISEGGYKEDVIYDINCDGDPDGKIVQIRMKGVGAEFDSEVLKTNVNGLGIELLSNNKKMVINRWYDLDLVNNQKIEGMLVKGTDANFSNGQEFNANAIFEVAYN